MSPLTYSWRRAALAGAAFSIAAVLLAATALTASAPAKTALAQLRVEGPAGTLDPGTWYVTGTERIRRSRPSDNCVRTTGRIRVPGPTALGLPETGSDFRRSLRQVRIRRDEIGLFVCEIGSILGRPFTHPAGFAGWTFYEGFSFGSGAADLTMLEDGDRILWVYSDWGANPVNTGALLELRGVPARSAGGAFTVSVREHGYDGSANPATGATIRGAETVQELGGGTYAVTVSRGFSRLRAVRGTDVPSKPIRTCNRSQLENCPVAHGRTIYGSARRDRLNGTRGWDRIRSSGGDDRIDITSGGRDRIRCGGGRDVVVKQRGDRDDRIAKSCERVIAG